MNQTICAKCHHLNFIKSKAHPDGGHWRCLASWPTTTNLVTGEAESKLGTRQCSALNKGNCPHFKPMKPICMKCIHIDREHLGLIPTRCKAKWVEDKIDPVTGDPVEKTTCCKYANQHFSCKKFVPAPEGDAPALIELNEPEMAEKPKFEKLVLKRLYHIHWILWIIMGASVYLAVTDFGRALIDGYFLGGR